MIGIKVFNCVFSLLILIDLVVALYSDGLCTVKETYIEQVTHMQTFSKPYTYKCGLFYLETCNDHQIEHEPVVLDMIRTRTNRKCCAGFKESQGTGTCVPVCFLKCINAQCTAPEECTCDSGYEPSWHKHRCKPKCDGCSNGFCTETNQCSCNVGYKYNEEQKTCDAICSIPCLNGNCTEPDVCTCLSGYHKNIFGICKKNECNPTSNRNYCSNGSCTSEGMCLCNEGFAKNGSEECQPVCIGCNNGTCISPKKCIRDEGFDWSVPDSKCVPRCTPGCSNGTCVSSENCVYDNSLLPTTFLWMIIIAALVIKFTLIAVFLYRGRRISYNLNTDLYFYSEDCTSDNLNS